MNNDQYKEALLILAEECAEVVQECTKLLRFGLNGDDVQNLNKEIGDVLALVEYLNNQGLIDLFLLEESIENKKEKLKVWSSLYEV
jgi:NTP pyrophosphatase (non-canonical NTP hydrolase)